MIWVDIHGRSTTTPKFSLPLVLQCKVRLGKLKLQFIVTACMDFQIFSKNFRFQIVYSNYMALWPRLLERCK